MTDYNPGEIPAPFRITRSDFERLMKYLEEQGFPPPTEDELSAFEIIDDEGEDE